MSKILVKGMIVAGLVGLLVFGTVQISSFANKPLDKPLEVQPAANQPAEAAPVLEVTPEAKGGTCGYSGSILILFTGADFSGGVWPMGADAVRLVKVDFDNPKIDVLSLPRDLVVAVDGKAKENQGEQRLGLAYHYEKEFAAGTEKDKITTATSLLAQVLVDNFALEPEHYVTLQLDSVQDMIDAIGGVELTLPEEITTERGVTFPAGTQTLDGKLSAEFVRAIQPGGEPARLARQNLLMEALQSQVISAKIIAKVPDLIKEFDGAITTDLSPKLLADLACMVEKVPADEITYYDIPEDMLSEGEEGAVIPEVEEITGFIQETFDLK